MIKVILNIIKWSERYTNTDMVYVIKNTFWLNLNSTITSIFSFVLSILIARFIDKDVYGTYQFILSIGIIVNAFTLTGMNTAITNAVAKGEDDGILISSVKYQIRLSFIPFIVGLLISIYYLTQNNTIIFIGVFIVSIMIPLTNTFNTWGAFLNGKKDFKKIFIYNQIINIAYYSSLIFIIIKYPKTLILVFVSLTVTMLANLFIYKSIAKEINSRYYSQETIDHGRKLSISNILPIILMQADNLIVFHILGPKMLAVYLFASNIPERFIGIIRPLSNIAFPKISVLPNENLYQNILQKTKKMFLLSLIFAIFYILISEPLFKIFFSEYMESLRYSQYYIVSLVISMTSSLFFIALQTRKSKYIYAINIAYPIVSLAILYILTNNMQITGTIIAKILSSIILMLTLIFFLKRYK